MKILNKIGSFSLIPFLSYIFTFISIIVTFIVTRAIGVSAITTIELLVVVFLVDSLFGVSKFLANGIKFLLLLLLNIQIFVFLFSGTYLTLIMVTNLASIEALSGKAGLYVPAALLVLIFSAIPVRKLKIGRKLSFLLFGVTLITDLVLLSMTQLAYSPAYNLYYLSRDIKTKYETSQRIKELPNTSSDFYQGAIEDGISKPEDLPSNPNIILIFAEGLSQNIIDDPRNIMTNLANFQKESIDFDNYFNHTFATYRGLQGQLYSGYQLGDQDPNKLVSLQSILKGAGYATTFINSEPKNKTFTDYLNDFEFDNLVTTDQLNGPAETISDKDLYTLLWEEVETQAKKEQPFFISTYSFGTHISLDSPDDKFEDGSDVLLNRFHNLDSQFGNFLEKFNSSSISNNTILVFTTDHATFIDNDFNNAFPEYKRSHGMVDEIPLYIYYKGISPEVIDVKGKNSLALAPTLLDFADISEENYFLGNSLFSETESAFDTTFVSENTILTTSEATDGTMVKPFETTMLSEFQSVLEKYYASKLQGK